MRKKMRIAATLTAAGLAALTGCVTQSGSDIGGGTETAKEETVKETTAETAAGEGGGSIGGTLEYMTNKREDAQVLEEIAKAFKEETGIEVEITFTENTSTILNRVATNDIPDITSIFPAMASDRALIAEGVFLDITDEPFMDLVNQDWVEITKYEGRAYAVPMTANAGVLYYNTDIFDEYGLKEPETIEELYEICETLKSNGVTPFAFQFKDAATIEMQFFDRIMAGAADHEIWNISEKVARENDSYGNYPEIIEALEKLLKLTEYTDTEPLTVDNNVLFSLFSSGDIAMMATGTWAPAAVSQNNPELNYKGIPFPSITGVEPYVCGNTDMAMAISATTDRPDDCKKFIEYMLQEDIANQFYEFDKCPNLVNSVKFDIPEQNVINDMLNSEKIVLHPICAWPASYPSLIQPVLQGFFMDKDIEAFIGAWDEVTREAYASEGQ